MHRLAVPLILLIVAGCPREAPESGETPPDTTAQDSLLAQPERASRWVGSGWVARTPNGRACVFVPKTAVASVAPGDSLRIEIERISPTETTLPDPLPPAFAAAQSAGRKVFAPMYEFAAFDAQGQPVTQFKDSLTFAICVHYQEGEQDSLSEAALAHPNHQNPDELEFLVPAAVPEACQLKCPSHGSTSAQQQPASSRRQLETSLGVTPAYATTVEETYFDGLGGKGGGTSPFAAVQHSAGTATAE